MQKEFRVVLVDAPAGFRLLLSGDVLFVNKDYVVEETEEWSEQQAIQGIQATCSGRKA